MIQTSVHSLAELRLLLGDSRGELMNQTELASKVGVTQAHISGVELGKSRPSQYLMARLAAVFHVDTATIRAAAVETQRRRKAKEPQIRDVF